jgi:predicted nucleic acid-binding protein
MTGFVFVDSNVLIYARDPGAPQKQARAMDWLAYLWREGLGRTSTQVLSEFYVNVTGKIANRITKEEAWQEISTFLTWRPQPIDATLLARAHEIERRWRLSWWDAMVVAAAQLQGCSVLLTEDLQDGAVFDGVTVRSPFTLDAREPEAVYAAAPVMAGRHRPRGRPRKAVAGRSA